MPTTSSHEKQQEIDEIYRVCTSKFLSSLKADVNCFLKILLNSLTLDSSINSSTKASLSALKRLCNEHHTLPSGLHLHNVQCLDTALPVTGGSFSDIYIGDMDGSKVALKVLRIYQTTDSAMKQKIKKVCFYNIKMIVLNTNKKLRNSTMKHSSGPLASIDLFCPF